MCAVYLCAGACKVGTEHNHPWRLVIEVVSTGLETIFKKLDISTTTVATLLVLDFILNDQRFFTEVNSLGEIGRNGVVSSFVLRHETLTAFDNSNGRFLDCPFADVTEGLAANWSLLSSF